MNQRELEKYLWGAATTLRGTIDAGDYKQFIFPLLFFKRICDVYDEEYDEALATGDGDKEFASFNENHRFQIPKEAHWQKIRETTVNVGMAIQKAMRLIEQANPDTLSGIFGDATWTNKDRLSDEILINLIEHYSQHRLNLTNVPDDQLGDGYEYLIKQFADDSGHTAAEFYTNRTVVKLMTMILDPKPGESVYDPTCGSGGLLLNCALHLKEEGMEYRTLKLYGQEINLITSAIARVNMFLHGIEEFSIVRGDTLVNPAFIENDELKKFNVVLANPPYSIKSWDQHAFDNDPFGRNVWGTPPQKCADYAFEQHIDKSMDDINGRCIQLWPHGVLERISEKKMRINMIKSGSVEAIIGLGESLFYNSAMDSCLLIRNNNKAPERKGKILFIDAKKLIAIDRKNAYLTPEHQSKIFNTYKKFDNQDGFSIVKSENEVLNNDGSLKISDYLKRSANLEDALPFSDAFNKWENENIVLKKSLNQLFEIL
jgi:type I restriction enzyme M protein